MIAESAVAAWVAEGTVPSEERFTFAPVTALFTIFGVEIAFLWTFLFVTAFFFNCLVPTLFFVRWDRA